MRKANKVKDLTGFRSGRLTVIAKVPTTPPTMPTWLCRCDCGGECEVTGQRLRRKLKPRRSCGCLEPRRKAADLSGKRFGRWVVLARYIGGARQMGKHARWLCVCDCGTFRSVLSCVLVDDSSQSCGCRQSDDVTARNTTHGLYNTRAYKAMVNSERGRKIRQATPPWADMKELIQIYATCPDGWNVDHDIPLTHSLVCGLHCPANLRHLPALDNSRKRNKFTPT